MSTLVHVRMCFLLYPCPVVVTRPRKQLSRRQAPSPPLSLPTRSAVATPPWRRRANRLRRLHRDDAEKRHREVRAHVTASPAPCWYHVTSSPAIADITSCLWLLTPTSTCNLQQLLHVFVYLINEHVCRVMCRSACVFHACTSAQQMWLEVTAAAAVVVVR